MARFDDDTTLEPAGEGRFRATLGEGWRVGRAPNGGFLAALGAGALSRVLPHPDPLTVTTHFLRRLDAGPVDCEVETIRTGRTQSSGQVTMSQGGREAVRLLAVYGDLAAAAGPTRVSAAPPDLPPPDRWPSSRDLEATRLPEVADRFDIRLDPEAVSWLGGPAENAELVGWVRFADGRDPDARALLLFVDALPPAIVNVVPSGWVPTIELTTHIRARPAAGWLRVVLRTRLLVDGYLDEDAEVWDEEDRLVAMSRQLALLQPPRR